MKVSSAQAQLQASTILDHLQFIQRTRARIAYFWSGRRHAYTLPGVNNNSAQNTGRDGSDSLASPVSVHLSVHASPNSAEAQ